MHKFIPHTALEPNTVYRLRIMVHSDSLDTAQLVTKTIKTESKTNGLIMTTLDTVSPNVPLVVDLTPNVGITRVTAVLYAIVNNTHVRASAAVGVGVASSIIEISAADLKPSTEYLLRVNTADPLIWDQRSFTTTF